jgi:serine/threonine protein kinase
LKPNNIIFAKKDRYDLKIKIIDFGLARDLEDDLDIPISTCSTPEFTSPEVTHNNIHSITQSITNHDHR